MADAGAQAMARTLGRHGAHLVAHRRLEVEPLVHVPVHLGVVLEGARARISRTPVHKPVLHSLPRQRASLAACRAAAAGVAPAASQPPRC